ncbi:magnesium protoporphyrin IX methyltransferase [Telmatospirillum siberiense]|uniref:Magnesium protoporphyrin IX methyltransferase n=1 Tax=Telmatospirillum siberiense TaxID=382514 RepID=A0A2N3PTD2_9PROT|nr:magnesium protoporphyrin IX methyltransferase [Telmatospirillum siberiense]PKU23647.1 magnesium protoporphyrin IX methyltransferase [Telmatospirillum siberiense]
MPTTAFAKRRSRLEAYFDHTALEAWTQLTSDAPVGKIRATVRAGRERMHGLLLDWLPADLMGKTVLDAGCGTGTLAIEMARRGGAVIAIDIAANLIDIARRRTPSDLDGGSIDYRVGDMLEPGSGTLDHVVAMDSLIHYETRDAVAILARLAGQTRYSILLTVAPRTPSLTLMHAVGRVFPRSNRAPAIMPAGMAALSRQIESEPGLKDWRIGRNERINCGFYMSQAIELVRR